MTQIGKVSNGIKISAQAGRKRPLHRIHDTRHQAPEHSAHRQADPAKVNVMISITALKISNTRPHDPIQVTGTAWRAARYMKRRSFSNPTYSPATYAP